MSLLVESVKHSFQITRYLHCSENIWPALINLGILSKFGIISLSTTVRLCILNLFVFIPHICKYTKEYSKVLNRLTLTSTHVKCSIMLIWIHSLRHHWSIFVSSFKSSVLKCVFSMCQTRQTISHKAKIKIAQFGLDYSKVMITLWAHVWSYVGHMTATDYL